MSDRSQSSPISSPLTDSPWFWLALFAATALAGLLAIGPKYSRREAGIERNFQARQEVAQRRYEMRAEPAAERFSEGASGQVEQPVLVPLRSLQVAVAILALLSLGFLWRSRRAAQRAAARQSESTV